MTAEISLAALSLLLIAVALLGAWKAASHARKRKAEREAFINAYHFPAALRARVGMRHPRQERNDLDQVFRALRQYFLVCLSAGAANGGRSVGMPSKIVDEAWHDFILMSRDYTTFCNKAFGAYLHHAPEGTQKAGSGDALANTLHQFKSGKGGSLGWAMLGGVPLLFAIDRALAIEGGNAFDKDAMADLERKRLLMIATTNGDGGSSIAYDGSSDGSACADGGGGSGCGGGGCGSS